MDSSPHANLFSPKQVNSRIASAQCPQHKGHALSISHGSTNHALSWSTRLMIRFRSILEDLH